LTNNISFIRFYFNMKKQTNKTSDISIRIFKSQNYQKEETRISHTHTTNKWLN